jgi:hypothetical protein
MHHPAHGTARTVGHPAHVLAWSLALVTFGFAIPAAAQQARAAEEDP